MDLVNAEVIAGGTFVFSRNLSAWGLLYPTMASATFRCQMRLEPEDPEVWYSWASDGSSPGTITWLATPAVGTLTVASNPSVGDKLQLGTTTVSFVVSGATGAQVNVATTQAGTISNLMTLLTTSVDTQIAKCTYALFQDVISITSKETTESANNFVIGVPVGTAIVASGGYLTGGGGSIVMETGRPADTAGFAGCQYVFDCRVEFPNSGPIVYLFGGTMTFLQPITR